MEIRSRHIQPVRPISEDGNDWPPSSISGAAPDRRRNLAAEVVARSRQLCEETFIRNNFRHSRYRLLLLSKLGPTERRPAKQVRVDKKPSRTSSQAILETPVALRDCAFKRRAKALATGAEQKRQAHRSFSARTTAQEHSLDPARVEPPTALFAQPTTIPQSPPSVQAPGQTRSTGQASASGSQPSRDTEFLRPCACVSLAHARRAFLRLAPDGVDTLLSYVVRDAHRVRCLPRWTSQSNG